MAESSNSTQIPPQQEQNPQQEQQPESPIPFEPATQVLFDIKDIIFNDKNEVSLLYHPHTNQDYFKVVSDFISKCCLREAFTRTPNQYKEYLSEFWYTAKTLKNSKVWFSTPTGDYARLIWKDIINKLNMKTKEKVVPYPRFLPLLLEHKMEGYENDDVTLNPTQVFSVHNWALKKNQAEGPPFIDHMLAICNAKELVSFEAPKTSSKAEKKSKIKITKGVSFTKGGTRSQNGHSVKETQSSLAMYSNLIQPSASTPVVAKLHKDDQQATGSPTSLGVTSEEKAHPHYSLYHYSQLVDNEPLFVQDDSDEEVHAKKVQAEEPKETVDALAPHPPSLKSIQIQELTNQVLLLQSHNSKLKSSLPTELKELPSRFNELTREVKELKKHVHDMEIELPRDLKEILTKLETFTSTIKSLATQVVKLKTLQLKIKSLDALLRLLNKVTEALNKFAQILESASKKVGDHCVPSVGLDGSHPTKGEKNTQQVTISQLFQRKYAKDAEKTNLNKPIPTTSIIQPTITSITQLQSTFLSSPPRISPQPDGELIKKDKGKKAMTSKDEEEEADQIKEQDNLEELAKADMAKQEVKLGKEELVYLIRIDVVTKYYKAKLQYNKYCD
ncbi:hypothetical protein Tco_0862510 [Tanacetum coccineum]